MGSREKNFLIRKPTNAQLRAGNSKPTKPDPTDPTVIFTRTLLTLLSEIPGGGVGISGLYNPEYEPPTDWNKEVAGSNLVLVLGECEGLDVESLSDVEALDVRK